MTDGRKPVMVAMFDCLIKDSKDAIFPGKEARAGQVGRHSVMSNECAVYLQMSFPEKS